jgi:hypothetical protein
VYASIAARPSAFGWYSSTASSVCELIPLPP